MKVYWTLVYQKILFNLEYVSAINQQEIAFTEQRVVPAMQGENEDED